MLFRTAFKQCLFATLAPFLLFLAQTVTGPRVRKLVVKDYEYKNFPVMTFDTYVFKTTNLHVGV